MRDCGRKRHGPLDARGRLGVGATRAAARFEGLAALRVIGAVRRSRSPREASAAHVKIPWARQDTLGAGHSAHRRALRQQAHLADPGVGSGPYDRRQPGPVSGDS